MTTTTGRRIKWQYASHRLTRLDLDQGWQFADYITSARLRPAEAKRWAAGIADTYQHPVTGWTKHTDWLGCEWWEPKLA